MRTCTLVVLIGVAPGLLHAQQDPTVLLSRVLPGAAAREVIAVVQDARDRGFPGDAIANVALEGAARGRSAADVTAAAHALLAEFTAAQAALQAGDRAPSPEDIQAAAVAMRLGVSGTAVSGLAAAAPSGRSLVVPLLVAGALVARGLPADQAIRLVRTRLEQKAGDAALSGTVGEVDQLLGGGMRPAEVARALAGGRAGFGVPVGGVMAPMGPPAGMPANGGSRGARPIHRKP